MPHAGSNSYARIQVNLARVDTAFNFVHCPPALVAEAGQGLCGMNEKSLFFLWGNRLRRRGRKDDFQASNPATDLPRVALFQAVSDRMKYAKTLGITRISRTSVDCPSGCCGFESRRSRHFGRVQGVRIMQVPALFLGR